MNVWVKDEGVGFVKGEWEDLYGKFYRGREASAANPTGAGLSLYWCKKIIQAHGGRIWAHSMGRGQGAEFGFELPS